MLIFPNLIKICRKLHDKRPLLTAIDNLLPCRKIHEGSDDFLDDLVEKDKDYDTLVEHYLPSSTGHKCFVIHPFVKWGPQKIREVTPTGQIEEAVALVNSLQTWKVVDTTTVPLETLDKRTLFGTGALQKLKDRIRRDPNITSVFINIGTLKMRQLEELRKTFSVPIYDRYNIVMQILRLHAISKHSKLQVALAELPYLKARITTNDISINIGGNFDTRRLMLQNREAKLKEAIKKLRSQRQQLRTRRIKVSFPVVAVVGYTNAGKTSLIKALTDDEKLQPKDQLFATLDVTLHSGVLPSNLKVLYVDTVGFLSDIPTGLIECFVATLEDAILADIILHVEDLSSKNYLHQRKHVLNTLKNLGDKMGAPDVLNKVVSVGNKCDLEDDAKEAILKVSAIKLIGINDLRHKLEDEIIRCTNRHVLTLNVPIGGDEIRWLSKNAAVASTEVDKNNPQNQNVRVVITESQLRQFHHNFC